jgi:hypothetical protein
MTIEEVKKQREAEAKKDAAFKRSLLLAASLATTIPLSGLNIGPLDKLNQTILSKTEGLKNKAVSTIDSLASKLGITGIETGNPTLPDLCPNQNILDEVYNIRQSLGNDIENISSYVMTIDASLGVISSLLGGQIDVLNALTLLKSSTSLASKFTPAIPGAVVAALSDLEDVRMFLTFTTDGDPKLKKLKGSLDNGLLYIGIASQSLLAITSLLSVIDTLLNKCGKKVEPITNDLIKTSQIAAASPTETSYKGFIFEIVKKPFNSHLDQSIGVAKNSQGIILLQTEPSFTTNPQNLIDELKIVIDRDNLKAN